MKGKKYPPALETERLILRPITTDDKPAIYKWASDPRVSKFMIYSNYNSPNDADPWIETLYDNERDLDYGFVLKECRHRISLLQEMKEQAEEGVRIKK